MNKLDKWLVLPDLHVPYHDQQTLSAVLKYAKNNRPWTGVLQLGDLLDLNEISHFVEGRPGDIHERIATTFAAGRDVLDDTRAATNAKRFVLLEGNHEDRVHSYCAKHPELEGFLDIQTNLQLKEKGIEWVPSWSQGKLFQLGNAFFSHGKYINEHHAKKMVQRYATNIYYGHTHNVMEFPLVQYGRDKTIVGKSLGCLCLPEQRYLKGEPTNWQQAFSVFYFFPDGFFTEHNVRIFQHRFVGPEGKVYLGR